MELVIGEQVRGDARLRESFFSLASEVFGLSFSAWYQGGYWTEHYRPYALVEDGAVIANVSANLFSTRWRGTPLPCLQIGTVMTHPQYRGRGCAAKLLRYLLADCAPRCGLVYLYANDSVLEFYPKFGFVPAPEYEYSLPVQSAAGDWRRLHLDDPQDLSLLRACYAQSNPFSELPMEENFGLLMFHCGSFYRDCVWYSARLRLVCVAEQQEDVLYCHDFYGPAGTASLAVAVSGLAAAQTRRAVLGFAPKDTAGCGCAPLLSPDETFFVQAEQAAFFGQHPLRFPALSHA